jgi:hypothetical protein
MAFQKFSDKSDNFRFAAQRFIAVARYVTRRIAKGGVLCLFSAGGINPDSNRAAAIARQSDLQV